ncbi:MAG: endonuclease/exonuclease/phosphatase family protein [Spirochaetales bacterium]|nr:endonuclease/exonuclease/phosphatase family protein [Spirochaetales bacterium]
MSYNVQNIFDDSDNGTEYPEFDPGGGQWGTSLYNTRLFNLSEVIRRSISGGPDIIALQEIENSRVVEDLVENYLKGMGYNYLIVTDTEDSAIQIGFISRLELASIRVHQILLDGHTTGRPILEITIATDAGTLNIFNNHWKSKLGGAEETEPSRIASAALLSRRINDLYLLDPGAEVVVLGDLNENWDEYRRNNGDYTTALIPFEDNPSRNITGSILITGSRDAINRVSTMGSESILLYTPWCTYTEMYGSYVYNDSWETIDHVLLNSTMFNGTGFEYKSFSVVTDDYLLNRWGKPLSWKTETGYGYSDHLPILLVIEK